MMNTNQVSKQPSIPRYGLASPFKGHFSTKSNAFCTGSSGRLSDQYRIRDHMVSHYRKILSARAAVDCSVPKSMTTSIKYSDQQRREKLKKDIHQFEKLLSLGYLSRSCSADSLRSNSAVPKKSLYGTEDNNMVNSIISPCMENPHFPSPRSNLSSPEQCLVSTNTAGEIQHSTWKCLSSSTSGISVGVSSVKRLCNTTSISSPDGNIPREDSFHKFQDPLAKTYSGDLLERHSHHFTDSRQPFKPRTLKTQAKSVLAQYRYYTPPRRKRQDSMKEAWTQTDIRRPETPSKKDATQSQRKRQQNEDLEITSTSGMEDKLDSSRVPGNQKEREKDYTEQYTLSRYPSIKQLTSHSPLMQKVKNEEEELQYLEFVADVTNEILTLGLFSNRVLERVFERHVEQNRHRLDERKMHHLLNILRSDLGYKRESTENLNSSETHSFLLRKTSRSRLELDTEMLGKGIERYDYLRNKFLSSPQQLQIEEFLEKEIGQQKNGEHILNNFLTEDLSPPKNLDMYQGTDPLSSDHDVELLSLDHDLNPKPLNKDLGHAPPEQDVNSKPLDQDVSLLSSHQEERPDALHTPEPESDNSDTYCNLQRQSKEIENLERYFARSVMVSAENSETSLNLAEIPQADSSGAGDVESERNDVFFQ
ncbi:spermatogenesis-associated protein 7 isoform X1 [Pleurodeles waltl]|uniref:spermatogenesis-associated protein 7 isoform X1 n=1 Tax=Pleurodeles waltl TaxID=8319 RepID=UPI0037099553